MRRLWSGVGVGVVGSPVKATGRSLLLTLSNNYVKSLSQLPSGDRYRIPRVAGHGAQPLFVRKQATGHSVTN